jgi:hypothetical protein
MVHPTKGSFPLYAITPMAGMVNPDKVYTRIFVVFKKDVAGPLYKRVLRCCESALVTSCILGFLKLKKVLWDKSGTREGDAKRSEDEALRRCGRSILAVV